MNSTVSIAAPKPADRDQVRGPENQSAPPVTGLTVSFVIPARNEAAVIGNLLASITELRVPESVQDMEVILADAESSDGTAEIAAAAGCRVVTAEPGAAATARNAGANAATGQILAFVDADCVLPADWLEAILSELTDNDVVATGAAMSPPPPHETWVARCWHHLTVGDAPTVSGDAAWLPSFNLAVRTESFRKAGGFDETLETCEDVELSLRLKRAGRLRHCRSLRVPHLGGSQSIGEFFHREAWRAGGSFALLRRYWRDPREWLSTIVPLVFSFAVVGGICCALSALFLPVHAAATASLLATGCLSVSTLVVLLLAMRQRVRTTELPQAVFLLAVYCLARSWGSVMSVGRRPRAADVQRN